jgi:hypothetical protein
MRRSIGIIFVFLGLMACTGEMRPNIVRGLNTLKNSIDALTQAIKPPEKIRPSIINGILIFLDDYEGDDNPRPEYVFGALSSSLLSAVMQEAGPIIASASLITNINETEKPKEKDPVKLVENFSLERRTKQEAEEHKRTILSLASFNVETAKKWIIKRINDSLYLLLPKKYLQEKKIHPDLVKPWSLDPNSPITVTEQVLGLKVNHMETVNLSQVRKPLPPPEFADYFMRAMGIIEEKKNKIFVTHGEYPTENKDIMPTWVVYIGGHGALGQAIVALRPSLFREFLDFLGTKITTKLIFYVSCYAAGVTAEAIYRGLKEIDRTYPFTIIAQGLPDLSVLTPGFSIPSEHVLRLRPSRNFDSFLMKASDPNIVDYRKIIEPLTGDFSKIYLSSLPQIKFPGLPWFSILDTDRVVSIGSVLGSTRTKPLDITTFFAKKVEPIAILLYAKDVPFELIISTKVMPALISMIPGYAVHHIKKISSPNLSVQEILSGFFQVKNLGAEKTFGIETLTGRYAEGVGVLKDVVADFESTINVYGVANYGLPNRKLYKAEGKIGEHSVELKDVTKNPEDMRRYINLSQKMGPFISWQGKAELEAALAKRAVKRKAQQKK